MNSINKILNEETLLVKLDKNISDKINRIAKDFCLELRKNLKKRKISADVFIGGSLAKNTLVKTDDNQYDIDIFVRFSPKYEDKNISSMLEKVIGKAEKIHGSRDYYQIKNDKIILEIIPVIKIKKPEDAINVTDLSYFHVNYVVRCTRKNKKLADEIKLAKAFAHACDCYGAESYIKGFSGYSLELLICHFGSFLKFVKYIAKMKIDDKLIIDDSKFYKKGKDVMIEMNESKIQSQIILVDPTFKERNALAGLSKETFLRFKEACKEFLKNPSLESFRKKSVFCGFKADKNLKIVSVKTNKQKGDIAGTKSKKFYNFFVAEVKKEFNLGKNCFDYDNEKNIAYFYLSVDKKEKEFLRGPPVINVEGLTAFKKVHKNAFIKDNYAWINVSHNLGFEEFIKIFLKKYGDIVKEMSVKELRVVK